MGREPYIQALRTRPERNGDSESKYGRTMRYMLAIGGRIKQMERVGSSMQMVTSTGEIG